MDTITPRKNLGEINMEKYQGPLAWRSMSNIEKSGYASYNVQKASGARIKYGVREYIAWYVDQRIKSKGPLHIVRRKDESRPYSFSNIVMMNSNMKPGYVGAQNPKASYLVKRIWQAYRNQRSRCENPNVKSYETYGANSIRVEYTFDELLEWVIKKTKGIWAIGLTIGRIDHSKNYSLDNIEIQTKTENSKERIKRKGFVTPAKMVSSFCKNTHKKIATYSSAREASTKTGISIWAIKQQCYLRYFGRQKIYFRYNNAISED